MSMTRDTFDAVGWFKEDLPSPGVHEETQWQVRLKAVGGRIRFEPKAVVWHTDRNDCRSFLGHNFRWGYNSLQVKGGTAVSRFPRLYGHPRMLIAGFLPFAAAFTVYTIFHWAKAGKGEPLTFWPIVFLGRLAYAVGMVAGALQAQDKCKEIGLTNAH
jgi:GT2 family glycosyltransferase